MKLVFYLILFVLLLLYVNRNTIKEKFSDMYAVLDTTKITPVLKNTYKLLTQASNANDNNYWEVNPVKDEVKEQPKDIIPVETKMNIQPELTVEGAKYKLIGSATNEYFNQYYILYETKVDDPIVAQSEAAKFNNYFGEKDNIKELDFQIYGYLLVKMTNNKPEVIHKVGPRIKIDLGDVVYLSYGTFELGPLNVKPIKN